MMQARPEIWLIAGIPADARAAIVGALAARLERSAVVAGDRLYELVAAGRVPRVEAVTVEGEAERQRALAVRNQCLLARSFAEAGFTPVLDQLGNTRAQLQVYGGYLNGARLRLVVLAPRLTANDPLAPHEAQLRGELSGIGLWIDSTDLDAAATVDLVLARQDEALLP